MPTTRGDADERAQPGAPVVRAAHAAAQAAELQAGPPRRHQAYALPGRRGMFTPHELQHHMRRTLARAKLPDTFTPHSLRHTYATQQLLAGAPIQYVRDQLGHSSIQITVDLYGSWLPSANSATAAAFERRLQSTGEER